MKKMPTTLFGAVTLALSAGLYDSEPKSSVAEETIAPASAFW